MTESRRPLDIAIVGCEIAGMAAAILLARNRHRVRLIERFQKPRPVGAGLLLQPLGLAVLDRLGVGARIRTAGARIDRLVGRAAPSGKTILDVAYADLGDLHGIGIHRAELFGALFDALSATPVEVLPATAVTALSRGGDGRPSLGDRAGRNFGPFDLVIDASGAQSVLRQVVSKRAPRPFPYGALWTTVPVGGTGFDGNGLAQRYAGARRMVGVMPVGNVPGLGGRHAAFFWSLRMDRLDAWRARGMAGFRDDVAAIWPEAAALLAGVEAAAMQPAFYTHYTARRTFAGRLVLVGDAAHSTSPQLGQGANMALLDAAALADALARHGATEAAFQDYASARRRHVRFYQLASYWMTPLFQSESRGAAGLRDLAFPALSLVPYARRQIVTSLAGMKTGLFTKVTGRESG